MIDIDFNCDDVSFEWENESVIIQWINQVLDLESAVGHSLSYVFCSDERLLEINKSYLNHDYYTDVITFDLSDDESIEGEIYISLDRVKDNVSSLSGSFEAELCRVIIHGVLHLCGYLDKTTEQSQIMRAKEDACLSLLSEVPRGTFS